MQFQGTGQLSLWGNGFNTACPPIAFQNPCIKEVSPLFTQDLEEVYGPFIPGFKDNLQRRGRWGKFMFFKKNNIHPNWYTIFLKKVKGGTARIPDTPREPLRGRKNAKKAPGKP
jgi:hypothetical protein